VLLQEPWFGPISTARSDLDPDGNPVKGLVISPSLWDTHPPKHDPTIDVPKVTTYTCVANCHECVILNDLSHSAASPHLQILTLTVSDESFVLVNFYHYVIDNAPNLSRLFALDVPLLTPMLIAGDFNTHSPLWSLDDTLTCPWAGEVEDWMEDTRLSLLSPPHVHTRTGEHNQKDTVLDLVLWNLNAAWSDQFRFSFSQVSFLLSLGSDHATMVFSWAPSLFLPPDPSNVTPHWQVLDSLEDVWKQQFLQLSGSLLPDAKPHSLAAGLLQAIVDSNNFTFDQAYPSSGKGACWWNDGCSGALALLKQAPAEEHSHAFRRLRNTIRVAKQDWAEHILDEATNNADHHALWNVARWHKGRSNPLIPPSAA
jgi:hypothetical protein